MSKWSIWDYIKKVSTKNSSEARLVRGRWVTSSPQAQSSTESLQLTCTDSDSTNKLLSPAAAPHHQSQVRLLDQLVHCALQTDTKTKKAGGRHYSVYRYKIDILTQSCETGDNEVVN